MTDLQTRTAMALGWHRARAWLTPFGGGPDVPQRRLAAEGGS